MKILVIGNGGREHALAWSLAKSPRVSEVFVAPGNAGTAREPGITNAPVKTDDIDGLLQFAQKNQIELTVVGPETPLVAGVVDRFSDAGLACFGPRAAAAQLEGSKAFCKDFMVRHGIPTAEYKAFSDLEPALNYVNSCKIPVVIKADGLAAGKGVVICDNRKFAAATVQSMLADKAFGDASSRIVIEEFLEGEEASFIGLVDGTHVLPFASSQDHKARDDGDLGPNTGGMGAYSPAPVVTDEVAARAMEQVMLPTVDGMQKDGTPYVGFLYAGLMVSPDGSLKVLEFNCRMGDPETQPIMARLNTDLVELIEAALAGNLDSSTANWDPRVALGVVLAAGGYPLAYENGDVISGLPDPAGEIDTKVFHAGTSEKEGAVVTAGGRVLCAVALAGSVTEAQQKAYALTHSIDWNNVYYRSDIGYRAIAREQK
ncbi:MAG: phosphoribosylamine--glycine ligase [Chromatiales bacterium]|jgi:phosphoribosylamine--glycine ligase|nr:phosphoribosylamine--glycine ligase [Chromatiales bacterium]